ISLLFWGIVLFLGAAPHAWAIGQERYVESSHSGGSFALADGDRLATIYVDQNDYWGVTRAAHDLQQDMARVTQHTPLLAEKRDALGGNAHVVIIGTVGKSGLIDELISSGKIDVSAIRGKWEFFLIQVVSNPLPGIRSALVIAGSDKRGTIFGIYDLSEQIGVSPWYWWADVPVARRDKIFIRRGRYVQGPVVKYRGIFLNDEAPCLSGWVKEKYGSYNHEFYEKVFELLLRLKGNYLWPAMWAATFNADDPLNPKMADQYGIVMGTSHHEPMMRAWKEWERSGKGPWDYSTNAAELRDYWKQGIERNDSYESVITLGMRGNGDMPMAENDDRALLEKIVADQRTIIGDVMRVDPATVPQAWALYKEVQQYYEHGMRVPDDVTLLWCDDNWGNIRRLPTEAERKRRGGAGIYYHFDYVGDPRSYKWINTNPLPKVWEQMNLAYHYDANRIWVVNVGDLKPMEVPIEFFLNMAWNPSAWTNGNVGEFTRLWAEREFGPKHAAAIARIVSQYAKLNGRRKPELLDPETFSLVDYGEADRVVGEFKAMVKEAEKIATELPENERDAFFELVLHPAKASELVTELYVTVGRNHLYAAQQRASTNDLAAQARALFQADADLSSYYNHTLARGKWDHMMDQPHIGYTGWRDPPANVMPAVTELSIPATAAMGVAVEGSTSAWPGASAEAVLPKLDVYNQQRRYVDVFNRGAADFDFTASASSPWIVLSADHGTVHREQRVWVSVDWGKAPKGSSTGYVSITRAGANAEAVKVKAEASNPPQPARASLRGFVEADGYVSIEAEHYTRRANSHSSHQNSIGQDSPRWEKIEDYGRTLSGMTLFPVTAASILPPAPAPCLEYDVYVFDPGKLEIEAILGPSLNFVPGRGLRYAISFDEQTPQVVDALAHNSVADWSTAVEDSVRKVNSEHSLASAGYHTLKFCMVDPGVVLEKLVLNLGGVRASYLGPPESYRGEAASGVGTR
ncbi:MAG TPA: glycosyl hydrolase 115 family protein, partial [Candidatus Sulfotelmatobacter sp.]